ncbi:MAG: hypothetical protein Alpg2KO_27060 [Alphaproteobacteria bacterium]
MIDQAKEAAKEAYEQRHSYVTNRMAILSLTFLSVCLSVALGMGWLSLHLEQKHDRQQLRLALWQQQQEQMLDLLRPVAKPDYRYFRDI